MHLTKQNSNLNTQKENFILHNNDIAVSKSNHYLFTIIYTFQLLLLTVFKCNKKNYFISILTFLKKKI